MKNFRLFSRLTEWRRGFHARTHARQSIFLITEMLFDYLIAILYLWKPLRQICRKVSKNRTWIFLSQELIFSSNLIFFIEIILLRNSFDISLRKHFSMFHCGKEREGIYVCFQITLCFSSCPSWIKGCCTFFVKWAQILHQGELLERIFCTSETQLLFFGRWWKGCSMLKVDDLKMETLKIFLQGFLFEYAMRKNE